MANKYANPTYNQIPHIVTNHPDTNPEHWAIMICLFRVLKDKPQCIYSSEQLSIDCRLSLRTTGRRLPELAEMGFITITGRSYNRRFSLGLLFNTSAKYAGKELNTSANNDETSAKSAYSTSHSGRDTKNSTNISTKGTASLTQIQPPKVNPVNQKEGQPPTQMDRQEYAHNVKGFEWVGKWVEPNPAQVNRIRLVAD